MSYGLLQIDQQMKNEALLGKSQAAQLEQQRSVENRSLATAKKASEMSSMGTGAITGAIAGAQYGSAAGPWGTVIGAGIGLLAGYLLS